MDHGDRAAFKLFLWNALAQKSDLRGVLDFAQNVRRINSMSHTEVAMSLAQPVQSKNPVPAFSASGEKSAMEGNRAEAPKGRPCQGC